MKRFALLILILSLACNESDDDNTIEENSIVGKWRITLRTINNQNSQLGECEPFSVYTFSADGTTNELLYAAVVDSPCLDNPTLEFNGTWEILSSGNYLFVNDSETYEANVVFSNADSFTMTFDPPDPQINMVVETYTRI